ncbi:integrase [Pelomonas saccharophila]|uniref:Integrase n=1 Tax=Roseateles saccharophilus TaxID=304 RepID=A0ABU1YMN9_ROSSA|nr:site-specific integrase [Roseateles saccharophilus]MDR7270122.1 integrase [Roseateles saccharophilus]
MSSVIKTQGRSIWVMEAFPLYPDQALTVEWNKFLVEGVGSKHQRHTLLTSCKGFFSAMFGPAAPRGIAYSPSTIQLYLVKLKRIVRWMTGHAIWRLSDLQPQDLLAICKEIAPRDGHRVNDSTLKSYLALFDSMWELRSLYTHPLRFNPREIETEIRARVPTRGSLSWGALPDQVAFPLIYDALRWIREFGPFISQAALEIAQRFEKMVGKSKGQRSRLSKLFYQQLEAKPEFGRLRDSLTFSGPTYKVMSIALSITEGACLFLLLILVGFRASEALALDVDCLIEEAADDQKGFAYLVGVAAKSNGLTRKWVAGDPIPEVVALLVSLGAYARNRGPTTSKALLLTRPQGAPTFLPSRKSIRWSATTLASRLNAFCVAGHREGAIQAEWFHPHMLRKTFAQLAVRRDRRNLEAVSAHLGHVYRSFTDQVYVGIDHELAALLDAEDRQELARQLEHLLTCDQVFGRAAPNLEKLRSEVRQFKGRADLTSLINELIRKGVMLAPCDWGYCVYSKLHSACDGDERGPNELGRSPEVCSTCTNFSVTHVHLPWWNDRATREEQFLNQPDLPQQTRALAERRLANTRAVLGKVIRIKAAAPESEEQRG